MENINFRGIPTSLFLNGPKLGISSDPQDQLRRVGVATFTGIATASFPNPTDGVNNGSIEFKWYFDGSQIVDTFFDSNSNASIDFFDDALGYGSTITINGLTEDDDSKKVYFEADYVPTAYSQPTGSVVTAGTARSTGNAFNEPLSSNEANLTINPIIVITSQPEDQTVATTFEASYSIAAKTIPGDGPVDYQWQLDGIDLNDGTTTNIVSQAVVAQIEITNDANSDIVTLDFSEISSYDSFVSGRTYTLTANTNVKTKLFATGAGGGRSSGRRVSGGAGGSSEGTFTFVKDQAYKLRIGDAGANNGPGGFSGGGNGGGGHGGGGGGGGFTGLFEESITVGNAVIIAGGGGGGANDPATGGAGGGLTGGAGSNGPGPRGGGGGTQGSGGSGGSGGGGALQGGPGAAGGGGGYYGGAGGNPYPTCCADGGGGGGSGYIGGVTDGVTSSGTGGAANGGNGSFRIQFTSSVAFAEGDEICVKTSNDGTDNEGRISGITDSTIPETNPGSDGSGRLAIYRVRTNTQEFIQVNFETIQTGVTEIKMNGGAFVYQELYNFYINDELVFSDRATVFLWSDDTLSLPKSYDIRSIKIEGADGYALGNLRFNGITVIGDIGRCVLAGDKTISTTITGSQTDNLKITTDSIGAGVIRCKVSADNVQVSPVFSRSVSYYVIDRRNLIRIEQYNYADGTAILSENDLSNSGLSLSYDSHPGNAICLYAGERDIDVEIDMYGGKASDNGSNSGGEGGYSKIRFTMVRNDEYILTGLFDAVNAAFLYRRATLIAVAGGGGDAGSVARGGFGGGVNVAGEDGFGSGGNGGDLIAEGTLPSNGIFGSATSLTAINPDTNATGRDGGRTLPCARGVYWRDQGKSPCEDLGTIKFRTPDGTEISNTAKIDRGYKSGYNIIQTKGSGQTTKSGNGGAGATGGKGGTGQGGGGGGSGYTDGSVTVLSTQLGGSIGPARINIKLYAGDTYIDDEGRILILSATAGNDPRNLTKVTDRVKPTDENHCIDDARWQKYLDFARDGTQDYRLTATVHGSNGRLVVPSTTNLHKLMNSNRRKAPTSLTDWIPFAVRPHQYIIFAWDEDSGYRGDGGDYSGILYGVNNYNPGWSYYHSSSGQIPFDDGAYTNPTAQWWILPPGVPNF